jgi:prevent-host-death family protein
MCYVGVMSRAITQRELRNQSGEIMQALDRGEEFIITRNGVPVGELRPARRRFVSRAALRATISGAPRIDRGRFRADVDSVLDQDIEPRS